MPRVVVAGSENTTSFAVIDFTNPATPTVQLVNPGFGAGCHVAIEGGGHTAAAGNVLGGEVRTADVNNPSAPVLQGSVTTILAGIGAIAIRGSHVAVGELTNAFQPRVALIDCSNPASPVILATAATHLASSSSGAIGSIAFISDHVVIASGPGDFLIAQVDFTNPMSPVVTTVNPVLAGPTVIDADAAQGVFVAGDSTSGIVKLFDANTKAPLASVNTMLVSVTSIALARPLALAGSAVEVNARKIDFSVPSFNSFNPGLGIGCVTAIEGNKGACGQINGTHVVLVDLSGAPAVLGTVDATLPSISTLGVSTFTVATGPQVTVTPNPFAFGAVRVGTPQTLPLTIHNAGGSPLSVTGLSSSSPRFTFSPPGPFNLAAGSSQVVMVTFNPNAEANFSATLTLHTNDPAHLTVIVTLSGQGGLPHISVSPVTLDFGNVAVCLTGTLAVNVHNSGAVPLHVSSINTSGPPFAATPGSLTVVAGATLPVTVTFSPSALGNVSGTLSINSDDGANPTVNVSVNGTGLPTPPPTISVSPTSLAFGATPVQFYIGLRITVANTGPCQPLSVMLTSSGAPFFVTDVDPTTLPPSSVSVSGTVGHNSSKRFVVVFAPTATGALAGTLTITSNDPANPSVTINLSGTGVQLNPVSLELVLDRSGSMAAPAQGGTKMDGLKAAVHLFADLVIPGQGDEMGSIEFDDAFNVLTPFGTFDTGKQLTIKNDADTLTPRNFTSIGGGLQLGQAQVSGGSAVRKVLLVFTDGLENTPPTIATAEPPILAAGTEVYAIGLGQSQNISSAALSTLAASSNGRFFLTDDTLILRKNFVQVLADAFRQNMAADPVFSITQGQVKTIPVSITECERRITFVLNWDNPASQLDLFARAPDGTLFNATSPFTNQLVRYGASPGYRYLQVAFPPIDPGSGLTIGPPQLGTWLMEVRGTALAGPSERCTTSVVAESQLELRAIVHAIDTAQPMQVNVLLLAGGALVKDAEVVVTISSPQKSLAAVSTPSVINRARNADRVPIPAGLKPLIPVKTTKHKLAPPGKESKYFSLRLPPPGTDGVYNFEFQAKGKACGGTFDRYCSLSVFIGLKPDARRTIIDVQPAGPNAAVVTITPKNARGEKIGVGRSSIFKARLQQQGRALPVMDLGNGTYAIRVRWSTKTRPLLNLTLDGEKMPVKLQAKRKRDR